MIRGFRDFLFKNQIVGLAVGVIIGGAVGKVVASLVADIVMPIVSLAIPGGDWRTARLVLSTTVGPDGKEIVNAINFGTFAGTVIDFVILAFCVYFIVKVALRQELPS